MSTVIFFCCPKLWDYKFPHFASRFMLLNFNFTCVYGFLLLNIKKKYQNQLHSLCGGKKLSAPEILWLAS